MRFLDFNEVCAEGDHYVVEAALLGLDRDAIEIEMLQSALAISGVYPERTTEGRHYLVRQWPRGRFDATVSQVAVVSSLGCPGRVENWVGRAHQGENCVVLHRAGASEWQGACVQSLHHAASASPVLPPGLWSAHRVLSCA
jgi:hypothetical protein